MNLFDPPNIRLETDLWGLLAMLAGLGCSALALGLASEKWSSVASTENQLSKDDIH